MTPGQRGAQTRRRNEAAARAAFLAERLPVLKQECINARAEVLRLARAFATMPLEPSQITADAANGLSHAAGDVWTKFFRLADFTKELRELRGGAPPERTIHDDLANVIDLAQRRAEMGREP